MLQRRVEEKNCSIQARTTSQALIKHEIEMLALLAVQEWENMVGKHGRSHFTD